METFFRSNHRLWIVTVYLLLISVFLYIRPSVAFGREGRIRPFGTGSKDATIFPLWWFVFVLAVGAYCITLYASRFRLS
jgi:hypothetical protein